MKIRFLSGMMAAGLLAFSAAAGAAENAAAPDLTRQRARILQELTDGTGVPPEEIVTPGGPTPGCTLGERLEAMLKNGTITQAQYDKLCARASALPQEKVQALKGMFDQGQAAEVAKLLTQAAQRKKAGPGTPETDPSGKAPPPAEEGSEIPDAVLRELMSGPVDTLGQRAQDMLKNGTITQGQYDKIVAKLLTLPPEKLQAVKAAYDQGKAPGLNQAATDLAHRKAQGAGPGTQETDPSGKAPTSEASDVKPAPRPRR